MAYNVFSPWVLPSYWGTACTAQGTFSLYLRVGAAHCTCTRVCYLYYYYGYRWEILLTMLLGSMLPQYMALSVSFVCRKKIVCPFVGLHCGCVPPPFENMCVRSLGYIVGVSPPSMKTCVSICWVTLWVRPPLCVSVQLVTLWVRPPLVCVLLLEDNLYRIIACCLLRFAAFFNFSFI